jgi:hypothetical protein
MFNNLFYFEDSMSKNNISEYSTRLSNFPYPKKKSSKNFNISENNMI